MVKTNSEEAIRRYRDISLRLGLDNTPLLDLSFLSNNTNVRIMVKDESKNVTGSVKIRAALFNIVSLSNGKEKHLLDASSGNYAKAVVYLASQLGYDSSIFVPESFSGILQAYLSEHGLKTNLFFGGIKNSDEAREKAKQYANNNPSLTFLDQYNNDGSWLCHYYFTAEEILSQLEKLSLTPTHFIAGIGSGGTLVGIGRRLNESNNVEVIGLESRIPHSIRGIRCLEPRTTPGVYSRSSDIVNKLESVNPEEVIRYRNSNQLGFGVSANANIYASIRLSQSLEKGVIVTVVPDGGGTQ